jgi:ATP synthase protein I
MNEEDKVTLANQERIFSRQVGAQAARKLRAQRETTKSVWFGLGMSGLIGWTVVVPTLIGAGIGIWVDNRYPSPYSWALMLLLAGLIVGCLNAWRWVNSEYKEMQEDPVE